MSDSPTTPAIQREAFIKGAEWYFRNRREEPLYSESFAASLVEYPDLPASVRDEPKVIQIAPLYDPGDARYGPNSELYVLRDDGSMWVRRMVGNDNQWREIPAIPTPVPREDS